MGETKQNQGRARSAETLSDYATDAGEPGEGREFDHRGDTTVASGRTRREITSLQELVEFFRIDQAEWEVERWIANQWQQGAVIDGEVVVTPLYQVKAWLRRKTSAIAARSDIAEAVESAERAMKKKPWPIIRRSRRKKSDDALLVLGVMDPHFGKLCWGRETGWQDYDVHIARELVIKAVADLIEQASAMPYGIGQVLLPLGNDFFHVDNGMNQTTAGTPQDVDGRRQRSYQAGRRVVMEMIASLREIAPVHVAIVPGNHDEESMFALGDALDLVFEGCREVTIDNSPALTKYFEFGENLIGLNHGKDIRPIRLPGVMAAERREAWGRTRWREWLIGHWHAKGEAMFVPVAEDQGVRVRTIPSLTPPDAWHARKGYVGNVRAAEALVYHPRAGYRAQFSHVASR